MSGKLFFELLRDPQGYLDLLKDSEEALLKKADEVIASYYNAELWILYSRMKNATEDEFMELPPYLTGDDLSEDFFESLAPERQAAHRLAAYLKNELGGVSTIARRTLILLEIRWCHGKDIAGFTLELDRYEVFGMEPGLVRLVTPHRFKELLMMMASGKT